VLGPEVPAQESDPIIPVGGNEPTAAEGIDEPAASRLKAPTELSIEQRFGPGEIRLGIERPDVARQGVGNCQNPKKP